MQSRLKKLSIQSSSTLNRRISNHFSFRVVPKLDGEKALTTSVLNVGRSYLNIQYNRTMIIFQYKYRHHNYMQNIYFNFNDNYRFIIYQVKSTKMLIQTTINANDQIHII